MRNPVLGKNNAELRRLLLPVKDARESPTFGPRRYGSTSIRANSTETLDAPAVIERQRRPPLACHWCIPGRISRNLGSTRQDARQGRPAVRPRGVQPARHCPVKFPYVPRSSTASWLNLTHHCVALEMPTGSPIVYPADTRRQLVLYPKNCDLILETHGFDSYLFGPATLLI